ncbi:MAG: hypothetical protein ACYC0F_02215 [Rhodanobacter sp.]
MNFEPIHLEALATICAPADRKIRTYYRYGDDLLLVAENRVSGKSVPFCICFSKEMQNFSSFEDHALIPEPGFTLGFRVKGKVHRVELDHWAFIHGYQQNLLLLVDGQPCILVAGTYGVNQRSDLDKYINAYRLVLNLEKREVERFSPSKTTTIFDTVELYGKSHSNPVFQLLTTLRYVPPA